MAKTTHTSYRIPEATRAKLADLAALEGTTATQIIISLVAAEHRYRRADIDRMKGNSTENVKRSK